MITVAYPYYKDTYIGRAIPEPLWPERCRDAAAYLDDLTLGRITNDLPAAVLDKCRMAVCAVADEFQREAKGGEVSSATNDGYSETYVTSGKKPGRRRYEAAARYLGMTGLLYRGVH